MAPRITTCSPPATTPSMADTLRRRDTCLPLLPLLRPSPVRWPSARYLVRAQFEGLGRLRPRAARQPPATARVRLTTEQSSDQLKRRPFGRASFLIREEFNTPQCPRIRRPCRGLQRHRRRWHNGPTPHDWPLASWLRSASPLRDRIRRC